MFQNPLKMFLQYQSDKNSVKNTDEIGEKNLRQIIKKTPFPEK